jgi:bla regulator protein BlaR1
MTELRALFEILFRTSVASALVAGAIWTLCRLGRGWPATVHCALWWLVASKLLIGLVVIDPIVLPVLPAGVRTAAVTRAVMAAAASSAPSAPSLLSASSPPSAPSASSASSPPSASSVATAWPWREALAAMWIAGLVLMLVTLARQLRSTAALVASSRQAGASLTATAGALAARVGLARVPRLRLSDHIDAPMVVGVLRPVVLLPATGFDVLPLRQQRMAICHELVHVTRGDLWLGCVPAIAERLFFFHPFARLAAREYLLAREAACDLAVLEAMDVAPEDYGRLLLTLGVTPVGATFAATVASRSFSTLKRRIQMLNRRRPTRRGRLAGWMLAGITACALLPIQLAARSAEPARRQEAAAPATKAHRPDLNYVLFLGEDHTIMSGSADEAQVGRLRRLNERALWFRQSGKEYLVRNPAALDEAERIIHPLTEIGGFQGEVGAKQGAIGAKQGAVGAKQGEIGQRQGAIGAQQGAIGAEQAALGAKEATARLNAAEKQLLEIESGKLDERMRELDRQMKELDEAMDRAGQPMADLDEQMKTLDAQMAELDRKMDQASAKADDELRALFERLVADGTAQPYR